MSTPGPWIQPPDVQRIANRNLFGGANRPWTTSVVSVDSSSSMGDMLSKSAFNTNEEDPTIAELFTSYDKGPPFWTSFVTLVRFDPQFASKAAVPPSAGELAAPHVIGYEYEGGPTAQSVVLDPMTIRTYLGSGVEDGWQNAGPLGSLDDSDIIEYRVYEAIEGVDYSLVPVVSGGTTYQQIHTLGYPNQGVLGGRSVVVTNHAGTYGLHNTPQGVAGGIDFADSGLAPRTYIVAAYNLYSGTDLVLPSTLISYDPSFQVTVTLRPPRYRLLYDVVSPQRQYPRDDGLAMSTKRSWPPPTSRQFSLRKGPVGTFL